MHKHAKRIITILLVLMMFVVGCTPALLQGEPDAQPRQSSGEQLMDGTYTGKGKGNNGELAVTLTVANGAVISVELTDHAETAGIYEPAAQRLPDAIVANQSLMIDTVAGATNTSRGILDAAADALTQAGADADDWKTRKVAAMQGEDEEVSYDIVVAGAGAAGTAAALEAAQSGAKVLLIEKTASPSGASTLAGGLFAADSKQQQDANKVVSKQWLFDEYMRSSSGFMNTRLVRAIIEESGATADWLQENGCKLTVIDAGVGGSYVHQGMPATLHGYVEGGIVALTRLIESFEKAGGTIMYETRATALIMDEDKVTGLTARKADGGTLRVSADAVILATGGYGGNAEMLEKYFGQYYTMGEVLTNTGDGIRMAWEAGADDLGTATTHYFWQTFKPEEVGALYERLGLDYFALTAFTSYPHLRVNKLGERFSDENNVTNYAVHGAQIATQPGAMEYIILDDSILAQIAEKGYISVQDQYGKWKDNPQGYMEFNLPMTTEEGYMRSVVPMDFRPLLDAATGTGVVFVGDTIEALAAQLGVDAAVLAKSVDDYNAAAAGNDEQFFAEPGALTPVVSGPYYAVKYVARNLGTLGGVRINEHMQAVNADGAPISGLYVAGADAGGMYGKSYVDFEGGTLGFAFNSGRLAGRHAAANVR